MTESSGMCEITKRYCIAKACFATDLRLAGQLGYAHSFGRRSVSKKKERKFDPACMYRIYEETHLATLQLHACPILAHVCPSNAEIAVVPLPNGWHLHL